MSTILLGIESNQSQKITFCINVLKHHNCIQNYAYVHSYKRSQRKWMQVCDNETGNNWNFSSILTCKD